MRGYSIIALFLLMVCTLASVSAATCSLQVVLLNQDPVYAVPGEYVRVVFQLRGLENPECQGATFRVLEDYPFSLDPGVSANRTFTAGTYTPSYSSQITIPYTLRVDSEALDTNYTLRVEYGSNTLTRKDFNITVEDVKTDFDIFLQDYNTATHLATFVILNTGDNDVSALTAEIDGSSGLVKGSTKSVIGSLDASQDTTFTFEIEPQKADYIFDIAYTDKDGVRRTTEQTVSFDPMYFMNRQRDQEPASYGGLIFLLIVIAIIVFFVWRAIVRRRHRKRNL